MVGVFGIVGSESIVGQKREREYDNQRKERLGGLKF